MANRDLTHVREAVAVFDTLDSLETAIDALQEAGFNRADLSLLAGESAVEEKLGHAYTKVDELEDDPNVPRVAYVARETIGVAEGTLIGGPLYVAACTAAGIVAAAGGPLAIMLAAAAAAGGGGALIGAYLASLVGKHHADHIQGQLEHGGLILWVRTWNGDQEARAQEILNRHSAHEVHVHELYGKVAHEHTWPLDDRKRLAPPRHISGTGFNSPEEILHSTTLDRDQKIQLLRRWEYDAREQDVAEEEGMSNEGPPMLQSILQALHTLGSGPDLAHAPPTKQGGI